MTTNLDKLTGRWEKVARTFAKKFDVQVRLSGLTCATDGKTIVIPANSDFLSGADQMVLEGLVDHEWLHIREGSIEAMKKAKDTTEKMFFNVFEDIRIERIGSRDFPGVAQNLRTAAVHAVNKYREGYGRKVKADFIQLLGSAIIFKAFDQPTDWADDDLRTVLEFLDPEVQESKRTETADDALRLAQRVIAKLKDILDKAKEEQKRREQERKEQEQKEQAGQKDELGDDKDSDQDSDNQDGQDGDQDSEDDDEDGGDEDGGDEDHGKGDSQDEDQGDQDEGDQDEGDQDEGDEGDAQVEDGNDGESDSEDEGDLEDLSDSELENLRKKLSQEATTPDLMDAAREQIGASARKDAERNRRWIPHPEVAKLDRWDRPADGDPSVYSTLADRVRGQIGALRSKLLSVIKSESDAIRERDHERGRLDRASLHKLISGGDKRIFAQTVKGKVLDTVVTILVDQSGSMGESEPKVCPSCRGSGKSGPEACSPCMGTGFRGEPSYFAKLATIALSETLDALGVPFEVVGFTNDYRGPFIGGDWDDPVWTRFLPFQFDVFKAFDESFKRVKSRMVNITGKAENVDGEAVLQVAKRLAIRPESRKIMFVLSDGNPLGGTIPSIAIRHLGEVVGRLTRAGIEVYGIGFGKSAEEARAVTHYYNTKNGSESIVIPPFEIGELAVRVYRLFQTKLRKAG